MAHSLQVRQRALRLYAGGFSYEDVADECGVSLSQLKTWGKEDDWETARAFERKSFLPYWINVQRVKVQLAEKAAATGDPQLIYALTNLMKATEMKTAIPPADKATLTIEVLGKLLDFLKQRDSESLRYLEPHLRAFADSLKQAEAA